MELGTMVRHCELAFHPHTMMLFIVCLLAEVVLPEAVVEVRSVVLRPEVGI